MKYFATIQKAMKSVKRDNPAFPSASAQTGIVRNWDLLKGQELELGVDFYTRLMRTEPLLRRYFRKDIEEHAHQLIEALTALIRGLHDPATLARYLAELGIRHQSFGVQPEHYGPVCECLIRSISLFSGDNWDQHTQRAWIVLLKWVSHVMVEGKASLVDR